MLFPLLFFLFLQGEFNRNVQMLTGYLLYFSTLRYPRGDPCRRNSKYIGQELPSGKRDASYPHLRQIFREYSFFSNLELLC